MDTWLNLCQVKISTQTFIISIYWKPSKSFSLSGYTVSLFLVVSYCETEHQGSLLLCVLNSSLPNLFPSLPSALPLCAASVKFSELLLPTSLEAKTLVYDTCGWGHAVSKRKKICVKRFAELVIFLHQSNCVLKEAVSTEREKGSWLTVVSIL